MQELGALSVKTPGFGKANESAFVKVIEIVRLWLSLCLKPFIPSPGSRLFLDPPRPPPQLANCIPRKGFLSLD